MSKNDDSPAPGSGLSQVMPWVAIITIWMCTMGIVAILVICLPIFTFTTENLYGFAAIAATLLAAAISTHAIARHEQ